MKELNWTACTEEKLWKYVAFHLAKNGFDTVLVGGAVVSIYTEGAYQSGDLDMVVINFATDRLPGLMKEIGFLRKAGRHYVHPKCSHLFVEFVAPPLAIGEDHQIEPAQVKVGKQVLKIYSPTDCIRDRLASYIHFKAMECLDQAVLVAKKHPHNKKKIRNWCQSEGALLAFEAFEKLVNQDQEK